MARRLTGRVKITANGIILLNQIGAVASGIGLSGQPAMELKEVLTASGLAGTVEVPVVAKCEVTIVDTNEQTLNDLAAVGTGDTVSTVVVESYSGGKQYVLNDARCLRNFSMTDGEGSTPIAFIGASWTENVLG